MMQFPPSRSPLALDLGAGLAIVVGGATFLNRHLAGAPVLPLVSAIAAYLGVAVVVYRTWPGRRAFGWANRVTLARAALVALFIGALGLPGIDSGGSILLATVALAAIALDGVDGWIARLSDSVSDFGARFDMEIDALLILALSVAVVLVGRGGWWVLSIGLMRYVFVAVGAVVPWWRRELPPSRWRKVVCVAQGVILAAVLLPWLQPPVTQVILALSLTALGHSFGRDALWLIRNRNQNRAMAQADNETARTSRFS